MLAKMWRRVRDWYDGEYHPHDHPPDSPVVFLGGWDERHWTASLARAVVGFHQREWKWAVPLYVGTGLGIVGLVVK